ncbi:MAG TPA: allophanate hydrolase subunit 1 [Jatrophihabitans sp.]|jgi:KipI family sensor histidine kinase inhibitor|uniref:5-oxoprolinase subunit B family protein n=1 Tax=Jatrophihabitans sp. TaxID=1932789 RepID=UPI002F0F4682
MTGPTLLPYGQSAVLVELAAVRDVLPLRDALIAQRHPAVLAVVPAARTVLVEFDPDVAPVTELHTLIRHCASAPADTAARRSEPAVELAVRYDGADLESVARECGMGVEEVIRRHCAADYTVQFCGFAPGFGYLSGLDPALRLPRLASPRAAVPAGSVAIAGEFTGVYPRSSPGGWRLLGRTDAVLFDLDRRPPALLRPGLAVRLTRA